MGQLEFGKRFGGQQAVEQVKSAFEPQREMEKAAAKARGQEFGKRATELSQATSNMQQLDALVGDLSRLGKKATYTGAGVARDFVREQAGLEPSEGSIARTEYISRVDNEILPLLRQTFGAQFTEREGQSLKATLGDPNVAPAKKDAVLRSFIQTKRRNANSAARAVGEPIPFPEVEGGRKGAELNGAQPVDDTQNQEVDRLIDLYAQ